jgi:23S rRNA pseudouridine2605 synthase
MKQHFSKQDHKKNHFTREANKPNDSRKKETTSTVKKERKASSGVQNISKNTATKPDASGMPLNKFIAHCGICSRRQAAELVKQGKVTVNDILIKEPGHKVTGQEIIKLEGRKLSVQEQLVYVLLNKPKGFITTTNDPEGRRTVMELVQNAATERLFPVGRLDRNTSGLLLLTNDGNLAQQLSHPSNEVKKIYQVSLDKPLTKADFDTIVKGVELEDGPAAVDTLAFTDTKDKKEIGVEIHSGKNRIVRRIFESLGYQVEKLDRVMYAGLTKKNLPRGKWRLLSEKEIIFLKHFSKKHERH